MSQPGTASRGDGAATDPFEWELRLYVTGRSPNSVRAIENLRRACEEHMPGHYELEVVDLLDSPRLAVDDQILAVPTVSAGCPCRSRRSSAISPIPTVSSLGCRSGGPAAPRHDGRPRC